MYYIYMLRCKDNSIYTGITNNVERRMHDHFAKTAHCANYTRTHDAKRLERLFSTDGKSNALKLERRIKKLSKKEKEELIVSDDFFYEFVSKCFDEINYQTVDFDKLKNFC